MWKKVESFFEKLENRYSVYAVRDGLTAVIPVIMIGAATLVFKYFPLAAYQDFIEGFLGGWFIKFLELIYGATFGMLSIYLTFAISKAYVGRFSNRRDLRAVPFTSLICFLVLNYSGDFIKACGVDGVFVSIVSALLSAKILVELEKHKRKKNHRYINGIDINFSNAISMIVPSLITVSAFAVFNVAAMKIFRVSGMVDLFVKTINSAFLPLGRSFLSAFLLTIVSSVLWFFGVHGGDVIEPIMKQVFEPALQTNMEFAAAGGLPSEIFTRQFIGVFVLMGGCGTAVCLLLAILLFSRRRSAKQLSKLAALPIIFNINEILIFGLPVILNPVMLIPFIAVPAVSFLTTYAAMKTGIVPVVISQVNWTAPVLLSGYMATGSIAGSLLQLFNIALGTLIYRPFVLRYDKKFSVSAHKDYNCLIDILKRSEELLVPVVLTEMNGNTGTIARELVADLKYALHKNDITLYYQPQFNNNFECIGAEALLRWKHPFYGWVYPPLVIRLAAEGGFAEELEEYVVMRAIDESIALRRDAGMTGEIGINVSARLIHSDSYFECVKKISELGKFKKGEVCLEITEQTALLSDAFTMDRLKDIKDLGYRLAIDDFSMGYTSVKYFQDTQFDIVKLDGSLIRGLKTYAQNRDIIESITSLSDKLGLEVIAEFVENEEQVKVLEEAGCFRYQGALYGYAMPYDEFAKKLMEEKTKAVV